MQIEAQAQLNQVTSRVFDRTMTGGLVGVSGCAVQSVSLAAKIGRESSRCIVTEFWSWQVCVPAAGLV